MNIFGIGFPELLLIFVIALIVLGPRNMVSTSRQLSRAIRKFITSNTWKSIINSTQEIRNIQDKIINDTGLPETLKTLQDSTRDLVITTQPKWNKRKDTSVSSPVAINKLQAIEEQYINPDIPGSNDNEQSTHENTPK
jgi:Sec-independent protein translocase protein TatA